MSYKRKRKENIGYKQFWNKLILFPLQKSQSFPSFSKNSKSLVNFFGEAIPLIESYAGPNFHLKITGRDRFDCIVFWGKGAGNTLDVPQCMSCDLTCPLEMGLGRKLLPPNNNDLILEEVKPEPNVELIIDSTAITEKILTSDDTFIKFGQNELMRCWLDGKARYMFIITPVRHVSSLKELSTEELISLWQTAVGLVEEYDCSFLHMVVNHGDYMNHAHLHLKIAVDASRYVNGLEKDEYLFKKWSILREANFPQLERVLRKAPEIPKVMIIGFKSQNTKELREKIEKEFGSLMKFSKHGDRLELIFSTIELAAKFICEAYDANKMFGGWGPFAHWQDY